jgi:4-amino-4-deoxy-L-arabinose transferase-like glycosyltransferase
LLALSVIFIFLFFTAAQTKLGAYILVVYPLLAILNGAAWLILF